MESFQESMTEYKKQLDKGIVPLAYRGLMDYMQHLRAHFAGAYPDYFVSGNLYFGYMDMTYFSFIPPSLKQLNLKPAIVFVHQALRFEIWLAAANKRVQAHYWNQFKERGWSAYPLVPSTQGADAIIEHVLVSEPDFNDLDALTGQIEQGAMAFIREIEPFLSF